MAVTDLTNTTWIIDDMPSDYTTTGTFAVNLTSNETNYQSFNLVHVNPYDWYIKYDTTEAYFRDQSERTDHWSNDAYKTITITGGTDVTNAALIAWLEANATQQSEPNPLVETTISVGTKQLYNAYLGQGALQKIYKGTSLIFNRLEANFETSDHNLLITSNGDIFNVQDTPAPSGFSVTINNNASGEEAGICSYSLDDGANWIDGSNESSTINLTNVTQIKFKVGWVGTRVGRITSTQLNLNVSAYQGDQTTQNYILTQNITDVSFDVIYD